MLTSGFVVGVAVGTVVAVTECVEGETFKLKVAKLRFVFALSATPAVSVKTGAASLVRMPETEIEENDAPGAMGGPV